MRIITGKHKGRRIPLPAGLQARPTTDFAKTGLFNMLESHFDISAMTALDLFAGTGNITFELISRGAVTVTFVDQAQQSISSIHKFCEKLDIQNVRGVRSEVMRFAGHDTGKYDFIFCDPPYEWEHGEALVRLLFERNMLSENGWIVYEHTGKEKYDHIPGFFDHRKYGNVNFSFFKKI